MRQAMLRTTLCLALPVSRSELPRPKNTDFLSRLPTEILELILEHLLVKLEWPISLCLAADRPYVYIKPHIRHRLEPLDQKNYHGTHQSWLLPNIVRDQYSAPAMSPHSLLQWCRRKVTAEATAQPRISLFSVQPTSPILRSRETCFHHLSLAVTTVHMAKAFRDYAASPKTLRIQGPPRAIYSLCRRRPDRG